MYRNGYRYRERLYRPRAMKRPCAPWLLGLMVLITAQRSVSADPPSSSPETVQRLPSDYVAQLLVPDWRAAFPFRAAFGSLCALGPLACALIDRPFAFNAHLELVIRPKAPDGSTGVILPFAVSVPLLGRAEVGVGSCYAGFWASRQEADKANVDSSTRRPSGLCPFFLAGKLLLFPWFRDPHSHPALAVEYLFEYQAGPFGGLNQLGLPGPLSKVSLAYRHPLGRLELSFAASVLVDHVSRAGTLQFGGHVGYRLPVGEHFWIFGQALAQAPSWGPLVADAMGGQTLNLAPPVAGTVAVGVQQRADFGFGAGLTLLLTRSNLETRVDLLFRLLSFEVGPHIKPLIPARERKDEPQKVAVLVNPPSSPQYECPPGYELAPQTPTKGVIPPPIGAASPIPSEPTCIIPSPRYRIPSPRWGEPCYLAPLDGSPFLQMGNIDSTGQYCEWDGLRLPLGAMIDPPQRVPHATLGNPQPSAPSPQRGPAQSASVPAEAVRIGGRPPKAHSHARTQALVASATVRPPQPSRQPVPSPAPRQDRFERVNEEPPSIPGSPLASGFFDGAKDAYHHARDLYRVIKRHGPGVVIPSRQTAEAWLKEVKEKCLDHLDDCVRDKAEEAAEALNDFRQKPWEDKKYTFGHWGWGAFEMTVEGIAAGAIPGVGSLVRVGEQAAERTLANGAVKAAAKKAGKEAMEEAAQHSGEIVTKKVAREAAEAEAKRLAKEAEKRTARAPHDAGANAGKEFTPEQKALVEMAKKDKQKGGISAADMEAYKQLNAEAGANGFTAPGSVRGPEVHPPRSPQSKPGPGQEPHGHVGPVDHIPIKGDL